MSLQRIQNYTKLIEKTFFCNAYFFKKKKLKPKNFETVKLIQFKTKLAESWLLVIGKI